MLFNSHLYIFLFLPFAWTLYFYSRFFVRDSVRTHILILASLIYYAYWNPWHLLLLLPSVLLNYSFGTKLSRNPHKALLLCGISINLLPLLFFKYFNFLSENVALLFGFESHSHQLALPLAISFFTFQQIAFLVDSHKGIAKEYDFTKYCLFVVFFPQLIAGPIVHHQEMMPQFSRPTNNTIHWGNVAKGTFLFVIGLGKKVILADSLAPYVQSGFDAGHTLNLLEAWLSCMSYTLQLYFDFSGYSDMALGSALLFNIALPINFNSPYKSRNIQEFWRRWHMTLALAERLRIYSAWGQQGRTGCNTAKSVYYLSDWRHMARSWMEFPYLGIASWSRNYHPSTLCVSKYTSPQSHLLAQHPASCRYILGFLPRDKLR